MKPLTAIILLFAIACHSAVAAAGSVSYCVSKEENGRVSLGCAQEAPDPCCPDDAPAASHLADCETCLDGKIQASDQGDATSHAERSLIKAPSAIVATFELPALPSRENLHTALPLPARGPPDPAGASRQFTSTVAFRL